MNGLYDEVRVALHAIWNRRWIALAVAWIVAILGWLAVSQMPNRYESKARVFVQMGQVLPSKIGMMRSRITTHGGTAIEVNNASACWPSVAIITV